MNKILVSIAILILTIGWVGAYFYINYSPSNDTIEKVAPIKLSKQVKISLDTEKIEAESYETVNEFLSVLDTNTGSMNFDIGKEDFYIMHTLSGGITELIRVGSGELKTEFMTLSGGQKNAVIEDIFSAYKKQNLYPEWIPWKKVGIRFLKEEELPKIMQIHNSILQFNPKHSFLMMKKELEDKTNRTNEENSSLAYIYDYEGDYKKANSIRSSLTGSIEETKVTVNGYVKDGKWMTISGATVELLNNPAIFGITNVDGKYEFTIAYAPNSRIRLRATEKSHSDGFAALSIFEAVYDQRETKNFTLQTPDYVVDIDLDKDVKDGKFKVETPQTTYTIPEDALVNTDTTATNKRKFRAYLYEFTKSTNMDNYMYNDTFDPVFGYVGNIMKTFGMPYMQIFDLEGNEVQIRKTHPAVLTNRIYHMKELYENYDKIYTAVTDQDMQYLVDESKKWDFPITREWLIKNNFLRWPAWWMLNRTKWVWESVGHRVIDVKWVIETTYYTID
jgi:hypothetical protein